MRGNSMIVGVVRLLPYVVNSVVIHKARRFPTVVKLLPANDNNSDPGPMDIGLRRVA